MPFFKPLLLRHHKISTPLVLLRLLSSSSSKLRDYGFVPPPPLSPSSSDRPPTSEPSLREKCPKPRHRPPSSLDIKGKEPLHSDLPFDFRFSYTESNPSVRPIGLREPKYSPFGPGRLDRVWTGLCAPAAHPGSTSTSVDDTDRWARLRKEILGDPLTEAERKTLVESAQKNRTKRQINLGRDGFTHNMLNDIHNNWKHAEVVRIKCLGVPTVDMENVCTQLEISDQGSRRGHRVIYIKHQEIPKSILAASLPCPGTPPQRSGYHQMDVQGTNLEVKSSIERVVRSCYTGVGIIAPGEDLLSH